MQMQRGNKSVQRVNMGTIAHDHGSGSKASLRLQSTLNQGALRTLCDHPRPVGVTQFQLAALQNCLEVGSGAVTWKYVKNNANGLGRFYPEEGIGLSLLHDDEVARELLVDDPIHCLTMGPDAQLDITLQLASQQQCSCPLLKCWLVERPATVKRVQAEHDLDHVRAERAVWRLLYLKGIPVDYPNLVALDCGAGNFIAPKVASGKQVAVTYLAQLDRELEALNSSMCQAYPSLVKEVLQQKEASEADRPLPLTKNVLAILVCNVENHALMAMKDTLRDADMTTTHLMFSKLCVERFGAESAALPQELLKKCSEAIKKATGLVMQVTTEVLESPYADAIHGEKRGALPAVFSDLQEAGLAPLASQKGRQEDSVVAELLCQVIGSKLREKLRYVGPTGNMDYFTYDTNTGCWRLASIDIAAQRLRDAYLQWWTVSDEPKRLPPSYFTRATHKSMLSSTGSKSVLACMQSYLLDPDFIKRLDSAITNPLTGGLLPFTNTCVRVDQQGIHIIPHSPEHYISSTIEYELPLGEGGKAPPPSLDFSAVDAWWSNYWGDMKKRKAVMMTVAGALIPAFRDKQKMIIVGTDVADGNTGKFVFWRVIRKVFGMLALPLQREMVYVVPSASKNSHGANEIAYRVCLLSCCDELKNQEKFDMESMKQKGGGGFEMMCRAFGSADIIKFPWMATVLLLCNKGCLPQIDCTNAVEIGRFRFICFESRFVTPSGAEVPEGYDKKLVKTGEDEVASKMLKHRGAHMWRLLQAAHELAAEHGGALTPEEWPTEWNLLKHEAAAEADLTYDLVKRAVDERVEAGLAAAKGETYTDADGMQVTAAKPLVDSVKREELKHIVLGVVEGKQRKTLKSSDIKDRLMRYMRELGYAYTEDSTYKGMAFKQAFVGCKIKKFDPYADY